MAWRNPTAKQLRDLGLDQAARTARLQPASTRIRGGADPRANIRTVFAARLQAAFPGVFTPLPDYAIHWGNEDLQLGIQWGGLVRTPDTARWIIMPLWSQDFLTGKEEWSDKKCKAVLTRIRELYEERAGHG